MSKYREEYQRWLDSPALSEREWEELNAIGGDENSTPPGWGDDDTSDDPNADDSTGDGTDDGTGGNGDFVPGHGTDGW